MDNSTSEGIISKIQPKHNKAMTMHFHWLRNWMVQKDFDFIWRSGAMNYADYWTKNDPLLIIVVYDQNSWYPLKLFWSYIHARNTLLQGCITYSIADESQNIRQWVISRLKLNFKHKFKFSQIYRPCKTSEEKCSW